MSRPHFIARAAWLLLIVGGSQAQASAGHWQMQQEDVGGNKPRLLATLTANDGRSTLQLIDDPRFGDDRAYLRPGEGGLYCPVGCPLAADIDGRSIQLQASAPTRPAGTLSIYKPDMLWKEIRNGSKLKIEYPSQKGRKTIEFELAGADALNLWK